MSDTFAEIISEAIDEEIEDAKASIASGRCSSFKEYKHKTGIILGLEKAKLILHDEARKIVDTQEFVDD